MRELATVGLMVSKAIDWDARCSGNLDPSGTAALGVYESAHDPAARNKGLVSTHSYCCYSVLIAYLKMLFFLFYFHLE